MVKKFKSKKRLNIPKAIIWIATIVIVYLLYKYLTNLSLLNANSDFLKHLLNNYNNYSYNEYNKKNKIEMAFNSVKDKINDPVSFLLKDLVYNQKNEGPLTRKTNVISTDEEGPLIYIYSTHQRESYSMDYVEDYNIVPDVLLMSHIMQENLNNMGIKTIVEERDITDYLRNNDMDYSESYKASRVYLTNVLQKYPHLKLIIDLHRDAATHDTSTVNINNKAYAKVMFVVGKENANYQQNLSVTKQINSRIIEKYPQLSRGIMQKSGAGVDGIYNQDLNGNIILLELGGDKNNLEELLNTISAIIPIIGECVNEG